ncbi:DUF1667 domain-containing protein [Enterocloster clostridioformis]|nr:DUF1667 domain-containing protein [Enterocloster clostridioformis]
MRSERPIPKECTMDCMKEIRKCQVSVSINMYDIIIEDICKYNWK